MNIPDPVRKASRRCLSTFRAPLPRLLLTLLAACAAGGTLQAYTFTGGTGSKVEAEIVSVSLANSTVRLRLPTGKEADVPFTSVSPADQAYIRQWAANAATTAAPPANTPPASPPSAVASLTPPPRPGIAPASPAGSKAPAGAPGETLVFEFPDLPKDKKDAVASCKVRLPSSYDPAKPMPLLLWFAGGDGGNDPKGGLPLVDEATWAVAAMPYPTSATTPRYAMRDGGMKIIREYHAAMLKKLIAALPNIDPKLRFVGGFSNGAHCTGTYLADGERDFIEYFRGYIIIEGGGVGQKAKKTLRNSFAYLAWGDAEGNTQAFMGSIVAAVKDGKLKSTTHGMKGVGHGFPGAEQAEVKKWIESVAVPGILAIKP